MEDKYYKLTFFASPNPGEYPQAAYAVFWLEDVYHDGVWWSCYSARPKRRIFKAPDGKEIQMPIRCERWQDVADRLKKSKRQFLAIMGFLGRA